MADDTQYQPPGAPGIPMSGAAAKGLLGSLFDLSFKSFVTPRIIQVVFIVMLILLALWVLLMIIAAFNAGAAAGILVLVLSPVIYVIGVLFVRIYLELIIVLFRIYETMRDRPL